MVSLCLMLSMLKITNNKIHFKSIIVKLISVFEIHLTILPTFIELSKMCEYFNIL